MKVSELSGMQLDYWVLRAETARLDTGFIESVNLFYETPSRYCPSSNWAQGGPIIERESIDVRRYNTHQWCAAQSLPGEPGGCIYFGPTPLIAAMRAYVASKFGDEVDAP